MLNTFNPTTTKVKFLKEWTPAQFKAIEKAIVKYFKGKNIACSTGQGTNYYQFKTYTGIDQILGLAYTSTGIWACYGVCNVKAAFDADGIYNYEYFTIGEDGNFYAVLQDEEENELTILL